jgi:hypothetical protein
MKKELKIEVPTKWDAVTLRQYLALRKDMETYKDDEEALFACLLHHLCHFPLEYLQQLDIDTYIAIKRDVTGFFNNVESPLKRFIEIDGVEYGFEPNLSQMAYGAYVDISKYENVGIDDKWAEIMSILYRPVQKKSGALYDIEGYNGTIDGDKFLDTTMDIHFGALFFFNNLQKDLLNATLKSLKQELMGAPLPLRLKQILDVSGEATHQSFNWHKEMSQKLIQLSENH